MTTILSARETNDGPSIITIMKEIKNALLLIGNENERKHNIAARIVFSLLEDRSEMGWIALCFMRAAIRKVRWLSMKDRVPSRRRELKSW